LDEIGDLSLPAQATLLRAIETKRVMPVGSSNEIEVDVRILAATHRNLDDMCSAGTFRSDLLFRLNTLTLKLPPLRERKEELEPLTEHFIERANRDNECHVRAISEEALDLLLVHDWPGNVRELRNVIERAVVLAGGGVITPDELPDRLRGRSKQPAPIPIGELIDVPTDRLKLDGLDLKSQMQRFEVSVIKDALARSGGNQSRAAELLVMPRRTLVHKLKTYGISRQAQFDGGSTMLLGEDGLPLDFAAQIAHQELAIIRRTLDRCHGDQARAARLLGIAPKVLARKLGEPT
jgi:DNA-binding NtrC family response regulator